MFRNSTMIGGVQTLAHVFNIDGNISEIDEDEIDGKNLNAKRPIRKSVALQKAPCPDCGKILFSKYSLPQHQRIHTGEKPYACNYENCEKRFNQLGNMRRHLSTHSSDRPFVCDEPGCRATFHDKYGLSQHRKNVHKLKENVSRVDTDAKLNNNNNNNNIELI